MFIFVLALRQMVAEKENHLLSAMRTEGLYESAYWLSWLIHFTLVMLLAAIMAYAAGNLPGIEIPQFQHTDGGVVIGVMFLYGLSMTCVAMTIASVVPTTKTASLIGFLLFAVGLIIEVMLSTSSAKLTPQTLAPAQSSHSFLKQTYCALSLSSAHTWLRLNAPRRSHS